MNISTNIYVFLYCNLVLASVSKINEFKLNNIDKEDGFDINNI